MVFDLRHPSLEAGVVFRPHIIKEQALKAALRVEDAQDRFLLQHLQGKELPD